MSADKDKFKLAVLLEKTLNPTEELALTMVPDGLFGFPQEFMKFDETNPFFSYKLEFWNNVVDFGKIKPRQLTEEEIEAAKDKKGAVKKDAKKEEAVNSNDATMNMEELTEEQKIQKRFVELEDPFKNPSIQWAREDQVTNKTLEDANVLEGSKDGGSQPNKTGNIPKKQNDQKDSNVSVDKSVISGGDKLGSEQPIGSNPDVKIQKNDRLMMDPFCSLKKQEEIFKMEEEVEAGGTWIYLQKYPNLPEEELTQKKKKAKGPQLQDFNPLVCKGWVDQTIFQEPGVIQHEFRVKLQQDLKGDPNEDSNTYSFEESYIKFKLSTDIPLIPMVGDLNPRVNNIVPKEVDPPRKISNIRHSVEKLKEELKVSLASLAEEYTDQFTTDLSRSQELKKMNIFTEQQKLNLTTQRKDLFVNQFITSDRYETLKQKIEPSIMQMIHDKFEKQLSAFANQIEFADDILSEIFIFLGQEIQILLNEIIQEKRNALHADILLAYDHCISEKEKFINEFAQESEVDKLVRIAFEYESLNLKYLADKKFKDVLLMYPNEGQIWYEFCQFNLRMLNYVRAEEALYNALEREPDNMNFLTIQACFYVRRERYEEAKYILEGLLERNNLSILHNNLLSFMYYTVLQRPKLGRKYFAVSQRVTLKKLGQLPNKNDKRIMLGQEKLPTLTEAQNDDLWFDLISFLTENSFHDMAYMAMDLFNNKEDPRQNLISASLEALKLNFDDANAQLDKLQENDPNNGEVIMKKAVNSFMCEKFYECEELFFKALKHNKKLADFKTLLRLGYIYLQRKSKLDAKNVLSKACELNPKSTMAWLGLGVSCQMLEQFKESEDSLKMANIFDPINSDVWGYTTLFSLIDSSKLPQSSQNLEKFLRLEIENLELIREVIFFFIKIDW